jgi:hypothetical protein
MSQFGLFVLSTSLCFTHPPSVLVERLFDVGYRCLCVPVYSKNRLPLAMSKKRTGINRGQYILHKYLIIEYIHNNSA